MAATEVSAPVLESAAQAFAEATANPPFLFDLPPAEGRKAVDEVQSGDVDKPEIDEEWLTISGGPTGEVKVRIVKPRGATGLLPVVFYIHGAGWVSATRRLTTVSSVSSLSGLARLSSSPSTTAHPRPTTRSRSNRTARRRAGS
jgi:acetyl esterase/lipase